MLDRMTQDQFEALVERKRQFWRQLGLRGWKDLDELPQTPPQHE